MKSVWNETVKKPKFNSLEKDIKTDVLIIGGGLCGILCAYALHEAGIDCILLEKDEICGGVTEKTTAKLTFQHGLIYNKIKRKYGEEKVRLYYESQKMAFDKLSSLALKEDADFENSNSFVYSLNDREIIEKEVSALNEIGCAAEFCTETELPFDISGAVKINNQAMFNPLKLAYSLAEKLEIYENTKVCELEPHTARTKNGKISAKKIIVATHFPFINKHGGYFIKMYQHRSYVLALKNAKNFKDMYVDENDGGLSFRSYNDFLLLGGGSHRTGKSGGGWKELERVKEKYYPRAKIIQKWATQDCMTLDSIPYIGQYSKMTPDLYVATGFNKWGMTSSMLSAMLLTDMICGRKNGYEKVYSPSRTVLHPQLAVNMLESVKGIVTPTVPRCPHMGCALKYNKEEHTWDCPCHGSRFEENGKLIENPATEDKN